MVVSFSVLIFFDIRKGIGKWTSSDKVVLPKVMMLLKMVFPFAIYYCMINIIGTLPRWFLERTWALVGQDRIH